MTGHTDDATMSIKRGCRHPHPLVLLLVLCPFLANGLVQQPPAPKGVSRRIFLDGWVMTSASALVAGSSAVRADDDEDNEVPDLRSGRVDSSAAKNSKKTASKVSFAVGSEAALTVLGTQKAIKQCVKLSESGKFGDALALLKDSKVSGFEDAITKVVNAEGLLSAEDRVSLGTIRRYGVVADYIITVGGAKADLEEGKSGLRLLNLASNSIDEIVQILRSARAVPK